MKISTLEACCSLNEVNELTQFIGSLTIKSFHNQASFAVVVCSCNTEGQLLIWLLLFGYSVRDCAKSSRVVKENLKWQKHYQELHFQQRLS